MRNHLQKLEEAVYYHKDTARIEMEDIEFVLQDYKCLLEIVELAYKRFFTGFKIEE